MKTFKFITLLITVFAMSSAFAAETKTGEQAGKKPCESVTAKAGKGDDKGAAAADDTRSGTASGSAQAPTLNGKK